MFLCNLIYIHIHTYIYTPHYNCCLTFHPFQAPSQLHRTSHQTNTPSIQPCIRIPIPSKLPPLRIPIPSNTSTNYYPIHDYLMKSEYIHSTRKIYVHTYIHTYIHTLTVFAVGLIHTYKLWIPTL